MTGVIEAICSPYGDPWIAPAGRTETVDERMRYNYDRIEYIGQVKATDISTKSYVSDKRKYPIVGHSRRRGSKKQRALLNQSLITAYFRTVEQW